MRKTGGSACLFLAFTLAGTSVVAARFVAETFGPFLVTALSLLLALAFLLPFSYRSFGQLRRLPAARWLSLLFQALFGIFLFRLFLVGGLKWTSAGEAGILTGASPAVTAILAVIVMKERPGAAKLCGVVFSIAGVLLLQGLLSGSLPSARHLAGNLLVLCAAVSEAVFNVISRVFAVSAPDQQKTMTPIVQTTAVIALALLFSLVPAAFEHPLLSMKAAGPREWLALVWYGGAVTALGYIFWYAGIMRSGVLAAAAFSGMMPLTSALLSVLLLGERAGWAQWTGGALVTAGMVLIGVSSSGEIIKRRKNINQT